MLQHGLDNGVTDCLGTPHSALWIDQEEDPSLLWEYYDKKKKNVDQKLFLSIVFANNFSECFAALFVDFFKHTFQFLGSN